MRFFSLKYSKSDNIGDEIQSLAAEPFLPRLDGFVDRDTELHQVSEPTFVYMNGWFKHGPSHWKDDAAKCWPPSDLLRPAFFGFHIAYPDALLTRKSLEYYQKWAPIGCRDKGNAEECRYRCLFLAVPNTHVSEKDSGGITDSNTNHTQNTDA